MEAVSGSRLIANLLWRDYSRSAMGWPSGAPRRKSLGPSQTTASDTVATKMPATTSSRKWLAVAITQNQTQAGQIAHSAFGQRCRQVEASTTATIKASAACRLDIAAYGF